MIKRGGPASSTSIASSDSAGPRNAFEKDFRGIRKPDRDVLPAVVEAGTLAFGFRDSLAWLDEIPKSLSKTLGCGFSLES